MNIFFIYIPYLLEINKIWEKKVTSIQPSTAFFDSSIKDQRNFTNQLVKKHKKDADLKIWFYYMYIRVPTCSLVTRIPFIANDVLEKQWAILTFELP